MYGIYCLPDKFLRVLRCDVHAGGQRDRHPQGPGDDGVWLYEEVRPCHHEALFFVILYVLFRNTDSSKNLKSNVTEFL